MRDIRVRDRLPRDVSWILSAAFIGTVYASGFVGLRAVDTNAYWRAWRGPMYTTGPMTGSYLYSPAFSHLIWPLAQLPWAVFAAIFVVGDAVMLAWLLKPLGWEWGVPMWILGLPEITSGNIFIPLAVIAILGFARPGLWAFAALTKVTLCVGPVWFLVRREWAHLWGAVGATLLAAAISALLAPGLWQEWIRFLLVHLGAASVPLGSLSMPPLLIRLPVGLAVVIWGALTNRPWSVPLAMVLCSPVLWYGTLTLLAAIPRLAVNHDAGRAAGQPVA